MKKRIISIITMIVLNLSMCSLISVEAIDTQTERIDPKLTTKIASILPTEKISVVIWFDDIDQDSVVKQAEINTGYSIETTSDERTISLHDFEMLNAISSNAENIKLAEYLDEAKEQRAIEIQQTNNFIMEKRRISNVSYRTHNQQFLRETGLDDVSFVSQYAPMMIARVTATEIKSLIANNRVKNLYHHDDIPIENYLSTSLATIYSDRMQTIYGLTGSGVKIGQIEGGVPSTTHSDFSESSVTILGTGNNTTNNMSHATLVASIMVGANGIAPDAELYSIAISSSTEFYAATEQLINQGVQVINMSAGFTARTEVFEDEIYPVYSAIDCWTDHIVYQHNVSFVAACGNDGTDAFIPSPAMSYNRIAVGCVKDNNTETLSDNTLYTVTNQNYVFAPKPEIYAPGVDIEGAGLTNSGTSFAAPHVTGMIAQLIESKPSISTNTKLIKALLMVGGHDFDNRNGYTKCTRPISDYCAGMVDASNSINCVRNGNYYTGTLTTDSYSHNITIDSTCDFIRIVLTWSEHATTSNHLGNATTLDTMPDLDVKLYNPSGYIVASSTTSGNAFELIHYVPSEIGTYRIVVSKGNSATVSEPYALVWRKW